MKISHSTLILISVISIHVAKVSAKTPLCCRHESISLKGTLWFPECENGQTLNLPCNSSSMFPLNNGDGNFSIETDDYGNEMYVGTYRTVHSPNYCVANRTNSMEEKKQVFLYCLKRKDEDSRSDRLPETDLIATIIALLFMISGIFLALTAVIYFFIPQTQDIEGRCTFHLTMNQSLIYLLGSYWALRLQSMEKTMLEEFCISYWYLLLFAVLSFFVWSTVLAFHTQRRFRHNLRTDESKLMLRYLAIGYGIPAVLVIASNIHIFIYNLQNKTVFYSSACDRHRSLMFLLYSVLPILITQVICIIFFVSLQRQLWRVQPTTSPVNSTTKLRKFKFRFWLNVKLFVLTGLPCLLLISEIILVLVTKVTLFQYLIQATYYFIACEGAVVFYMLVISRKRILQGIADKLGITVTGWQPCPESEESIAYSNENENDPNREL